MQNSYVNMCVV